MSSASASQAPRRPAEVEAPAVAGAAVGFAATGLSLAHVLTPASLLLTALALVAAAGLVHGAILDTAAPPPHVEAFGGEASEPESALEERGEPEAGP